MIDRSPSATLYDHLGDAYTQTHDFAKAETAYRKATDLDPTELSHLAGLRKPCSPKRNTPKR